MQLALTLAGIFAPIFALAGIGYTWARSGAEYPISFVTQLTMGLSTPCLLFVSLVNTHIAPDALAAITTASLATYTVLALLFAGILRVLRLDFRTNLAPMTFGNTGNLGLPLALFAFGQTGLELAVVVFAMMAILSFTIGVWFVSGHGGWRKMLRERIVWATVLGALCLWQNYTPPAIAMDILTLIGQMAIPLQLITLGVAMSRLRPNGMLRAFGLSAVKIACCAGIAFIMGNAFGLATLSQAVLLMQVSTPVAVTSYFLALKYEADSDAVAALVVASTFLSLGSLPLLLAMTL